MENCDQILFKKLTKSTPKFKLQSFGPDDFFKPTKTIELVFRSLLFILMTFFAKIQNYSSTAGHQPTAGQKTKISTIQRDPDFSAYLREAFYSIFTHRFDF